MTSQIDLYKILVVDDSLTVRMEIKDIFEASGYRVLLAENGCQCLELLETEQPDIILLDVKMPEMDGYEVCRRLKSNEHCQTVPVIFISASGETAKKVEGFKAGGVDYIAKPFDREEVLARVGVHLRLRELSEQLEREVNQRTAELTLANQELRQQIAERRRVEEELYWEAKERTAELAERKKMEQNLLLMNFALNHIRESAFLIDENARFHFVNEESCRILGYTREELLDMGVADIDPDRPIERWPEHWDELKTQGSLTFEGRYCTKDNRIFPVEINANYIEYGGRAYNLALVRDIAQRKQAEAEIRQLNQELEQRVADRTSELVAANQELEAFAYSVSHDLRAPLRHIDGFLELLQKNAGSAPDEQSRHYMEIISDSAKKMGLLIDDLLSFSRMGRQEMAFQEVDLRALVRDVIRELEPDAADRTIDWRIGDLPAVEGDAAMLRMVLDNLITNALKFTRPREEARIEIGSQPDQNAETVIYVRDNGVGFDMTYAHKLFGVFQRLHRADEFEGTGIGLANVRRIIARHGGRTWAQGEPDQGAAFYFSLPRSIQGA